MSAPMSDREKSSLRGPVKSYTEGSTYPGGTDAEGKTYPDSHSEYTTEYDPDGRVVSRRSRNSDGTYWVNRYGYDASGRLLKIATGVEGQATTETMYSYDQHGRLQTISSDGKSESPATFRYDERGRKTKIATSSPSAYRPNVAYGGSPFEAAEGPPNLPGGGSATTIYDENDRPTEVQVRNAEGELVNRAVRKYDAKGRTVEEEQILEGLDTMFPPEARAKMLEESGLSPDQLRQELHAQLTKLMAGNTSSYSVSYSYDAEGRVTHATRRIFNQKDEIDTTYNEQGDMASEITRSEQLAGKNDPATPARLPSYSEVRYSYQYDHNQNWLEQEVSYRNAPDGAFQSSSVMRRTLTYY